MPAILLSLTFERTLTTSSQTENLVSGEKIETERRVTGKNEYTAEFLVQGADVDANRRAGKMYVTVRGDSTTLPGDKGIDDVGAWIAANVANIVSTPPTLA